MIKTITTEFESDRIVCIERGDLILFAEVIESVPARSCYWVRPLVIARANLDLCQLTFLFDLREAAQLILPVDLFRDALDTEVIPLISELFHSPRATNLEPAARRALHEFITDLYPPIAAV